MPGYVPRKGDFLAVTFDPQSGHEQRGRRPALVVSNDLFLAADMLAASCLLDCIRQRHDQLLPLIVPVS